MSQIKQKKDTNQKQGRYIKGCWFPAEEPKPKRKISNPKGNNKHTPKAELVGKKEHPLRLLNKDELFEERQRCFKEKRYYSTMVLSYSQKIAFIDRLLGLEHGSDESIKKALKDFEEKEGKLDL